MTMATPTKGGVERFSIPGDNQYIRKSKEEIRKLALDNMAGSVFGSWQMSEHDFAHASLVFLPLTFSNDFHYKGWQRDEIIHFYGHLSDALNRSVNGMPIFHSFYTINQTDLERVFKMQKLISDIEESD
jgi:hypothetical protein